MIFMKSQLNFKPNILNSLEELGVLQNACNSQAYLYAKCIVGKFIDSLQTDTLTIYEFLVFV